MSGRGRRRIWKFQIPEVSFVLGRARPGKVEEESFSLGIADTLESVDILYPPRMHVPRWDSGPRPIVLQRNKISFLAFEVANTIAKGAALMRSLSEENLQFLKKEILQSEGIQRLVSTDIQELLSIVAADKSEEFDVFSKEVVRFGTYCRDPQWHDLERYFERLKLEQMPPIVGRLLKEEAETMMQRLVEWENITYELYHELQALETLENDYQQNHQEEEVSSRTAQRGNLLILRRELKQQKKLVKSLKKKSLWSRNFEEVIGKLVDIVIFLRDMILEAFWQTGINVVNRKQDHVRRRLGVLGLAFHYANVIGLIDSIVSRPISLPPSTRDTLYDALPVKVKSALRLELQSFHAKDGLAVALIESEMQKILQWLFPMADNTIVHQGFGGIGDWAKMRTEHDKRPTQQYNVIRIQTLHHADKERTEAYILHLVVRLHHLASYYYGFVAPKSIQYPRRKNTFSTQKPIQLSEEDRRMLERMSSKRLVLGRSQSYDSFCKKNKGRRVVRSCHSSPSTEKAGLEFCIE